MYPFGSGGPPPPNSSAPYPQAPFGSGMPQPGQAPYPHSSPYPHASPYPPNPSSMPYPNYNPNPGYPSQTPGYPPASTYPQGGGGYPQGGGGYPQGGGGYPPQSSTGYPPQSSAGYPPFGAGYPPANTSSPYPGSYPQTPSSTPAVTSYQNPYQPAPANPYPSQAPTGTGGLYPGMPGAGGAAMGMAQCFGEMKTHVTRINSEIKSKGTPTVRAAPDFNPVADAQALRKAMKGFGTDEDALINVICRRSNEQRQIIAREYKTNFGKDLIEDIKSETSGNFENLLVALMTPIVDFYAKELHDAMSGVGTDEDVLIEVLGSMSNYEIHTIKFAFEKIYGQSLENQLISETSGNFKRLLVSLCVGGRDESGVTDPVAAQNDARELLKAGELRIGTDESTFNMVLCQRNYAQIRLICDEYQKMTGHTLEKAIRKEFSGDIMEGLLAIIGVVCNKTEYFASLLKKSMAGIGTNDRQLIRLVVTRCEIDMADIKTAFERLYGKSLKSWIKGDTSGHYKHALYALIGEERSS
uniref:Annexin n=1 Tax=Lutzomyia longipalpis TaxID=7200 RepID=A0A7G3A871_LUTLO